MNLVYHDRPIDIGINEFGLGLTLVNEDAFMGITASGPYGTPDYKQIAEWDEDIAPYPTVEELKAAISIGSWKRVRTERNKRLTDTDWYALSDVTMPEEIATYRQTLRDLPQTYSSSKDVIWPNLAVNSISTFLNGEVTDDAKTITVDSTAGFPEAGTIQIQDEMITYTGTTPVTFGGCVRGAADTSAVTHETEVIVTTS